MFHQPDLLKRLTFVSHVLTVAALTVSDLILIIIFFLSLSDQQFLTVSALMQRQRSDKRWVYLKRTIMQKKCLYTREIHVKNVKTEGRNKRNDPFQSSF